MTDPGPALVLRRDPRQQYGLVATVAAGLLVTIPLMFVMELGLGLEVDVITFVVRGVSFFLVYSAVLLVLSAWQRTEVSPYGIESSNGFRSTGLSWAEVVAIEERTVLGQRSVRVVAPHRVLKLRVPWSGPGLLRDAEFDDKVATMRAWWHAYTPVPVVPAPERLAMPPVR